MANGDDGWFSRERALALVLTALSALAFYVCYLLARPFLPALAWALALAIVAHPMHAWLERALARPNLAAGLSVAIVALILLAPTVFVVGQIAAQIAPGVEALQTKMAETSEKYNLPAPLAEWIEKRQEPSELQEAFNSIAQSASSVVGGSIWALAQLLFTAFILFYFFRDRDQALRWLKSLLPLTSAETNHAFRRIEDTIFATVYGSLLMAALQGALGGLIFWLLGLPAPVLWGAVMGLLAVIPTLGTFVIWGPAALMLALSGDYLRALALVAWGCLAIGLIDNFLYPMVVGKRLRLHPLLVFIAVVGGVSAFGASGIVLGPVALSVTDALIEVWRRRTADGGLVDDAAAPALSVPEFPSADSRD